MSKYVAFTMAVIWMLAGFQQAVASCYNGYGQITFTKYWIAQEGSQDETDWGREITLTGPKTLAIVGEDGETIAKVDGETYHKCVQEGSCFLENGRLINVGSQSNVFVVVDMSSYPYGMGAWNNPLMPYVSVASQDLPKSSKLFVKELYNVQLPSGQIHNGCVRVDDRSSANFGSCHIDLFVVKYANYKALTFQLPDHAHAVIDSSCQILSYA